MNKPGKTSSIKDERMVTDQPTEPEDNRVELFINKPIEDLELEILLLFFEDTKSSGGGDIDEFEIDESKRHLTVKFKDVESKNRVLQNQVCFKCETKRQTFLNDS